MEEYKMIYKKSILCYPLMLFAAGQLSAQSHPNVILIMADDMGFSDLGCYGGEINTPNLDNLAENGVRFSQFYNNARSCPSRAALLTGLYPHQAGVGGMVGNGHADLSMNAVTIAEALKTKGYVTYMTGKWHVADSFTNDDMHNWPIQRGFDQFFGTITGVGSYFDPHTLTYNNDAVNLRAEDNFYYTDAISDSTVSFINKHFKEKTETPFFFYVSYTAPHWPLHALEKDINKYEGVFDKGWDLLRQERFDRMKKMGVIPENAKLSEREHLVSAWEDVENKDWESQRMMTYAAQIDNMDQGIGRIADKLKEVGAFDNTLIIFLSDNGACAEILKDDVKNWVGPRELEITLDGDKVTPGNVQSVMAGPATTYMSYGRGWANLSNTPYRKYKKSGHEGGVASPFIMHWPKTVKEKNTIKKDLVSIIDLMPTILDISSTEYPLTFKRNEIQQMEGLSLVPILQNEKLKRTEWFVEHGKNKAYRKKNWKIAYSKEEGDRKWELYNLKDDPTEMNDLANKYPEKLNNMINRWIEWAKRVKVSH